MSSPAPAGRGSALGLSVYHVAVDGPDGLLAVCAEDGKCVLVDGERPRMRLDTGGDECLRCAWSPRADRIATANADGTLRVFVPAIGDAGSEPPVPATEARLEEEAYALEFVADSALLAGFSDCIAVFDLERSTGSRAMADAAITVPFRPSGAAYGGERNPEGRAFVFGASSVPPVVAVALSDGTLRMLDLRAPTGTVLQLQAHDGPASCCAFQRSADASRAPAPRLASCGRDGTVTDWDLRRVSGPVWAASIGAPAFHLSWVDTDVPPAPSRWAVAARPAAPGTAAVEALSEAATGAPGPAADLLCCTGSGSTVVGIRRADQQDGVAGSSGSGSGSVLKRSHGGWPMHAMRPAWELRLSPSGSGGGGAAYCCAVTAAGALVVGTSSAPAEHAQGHAHDHDHGNEHSNEDSCGGHHHHHHRPTTGHTHPSADAEGEDPYGWVDVSLDGSRCVEGPWWCWKSVSNARPSRGLYVFK